MTAPEAPQSSAYVRLLVLSFLAGAAILAAELAAPRLTAPHLGTGLISWSGIFAVFLAGMAVGNWVGGRLADRGTKRTLPVMFAAAGLLIALAVPLDLWLRGGALQDVPRGARVLLAVAIAFGPGAIGCGLIGPALGRAVLAASARPGKALGTLGAASAVGSVFGTFITGFLLVPHVGTRAIYLGAGALLLACIPMAATVPVAQRSKVEAPPPAVPRGWVWLAALAGAALLVVEVIAARVAANRLGTSVYTWTSVIGVVLVALGLGNAIGGRLADRFEPRGLLAKLLLLASVGVAACLWTPALMTYAAGLDQPWILRTLIAVAAGFLVPSLAIGTLTPVVIRAALTDPAVDGRTVGRLYAIGTWGAVAGSVLTGWLLIPLLQVPLLIVVLALGLALASWRLGGRGELPWIGTLVAVGLLIALPFGFVRDLGLAIGIREDRPGVHVEDSRYFHIGVEPHDLRRVRLREPMDASAVLDDPLLRDQLAVDPERRLMLWRGPMSTEQLERLVGGIRELGNREAARELHDRAKHEVKLLTLDRFVHGFVDLQDPLWLEYDYEVLMGALVRELMPKREGDVHAFFIGGGTYTLQRRLRSLYPRRAYLYTAEIDPAVTRVAMEHLGLRYDRYHRVLHEDARTALRKFEHKEWGFDFVFGDAFHDLGVPWHLTTVEFARAVKARMAKDGVYVVNLIDSRENARFLASFVGTLSSVFEHYRVLHLAGTSPDEQETFIVVASDAPLTWGELRDDEGRALDVREIPDALKGLDYDRSLLGMADRTGAFLLTDDHAPVEALLAPVVRKRADGGLRRR